MLEMIVSDGNNGAAYAAIVAAKDLGLKTGGIAAKGYMVTLYDMQQVPNLLLGTKFGLAEHDTDSAVDVSYKNVSLCCGIVCFGRKEHIEGAINEAAVTYNKPIIFNPSAKELADFVVNNNVRVLNVSGSVTSSNNKDIYARTYIVVYEALLILISKSQCCIVNNTVNLDSLTREVMGWFEEIVVKGFKTTLTKDQNHILTTSLQERIKCVLLVNKSNVY